MRRAEFSDFEVLRGAVQDAPVDIVQLQPGKMTGKLMHLSVGSLGISTGSFSRAVRSRGALSEHRWTLGTLLDAPALLQDVKSVPGDVLTLAPNEELYTRFLGANTYLTTLIEPDELVSFLSTQPGAQDAAVWRQPTTVLARDPATVAASVKQLSMLLTALAEHGPMLSAGAGDFFKRNILEMLTAPVRDAVPYQGRRVRSAVELVRKVDRYLVDAGNRPIHISELCAEFDVGRRMLHRAFNEVVGIPPISFLRRKRLGDVHAALLTGGPAVTVKAVAIEHGFAELGRFAATYRRMFGELPSRTLQRQISGS